MVLDKAIEMRRTHDQNLAHAILTMAFGEKQEEDTHG